MIGDYCLAETPNPWSYDVEIYRVRSTTNAIDSLNARYRCAIKARGHFLPS
jgi:transposase-like protein